MLIAPEPIAREMRIGTKLFLLLMRYRQYDRIWHELVALDAIEVISTTAFPIRYLTDNEIDSLALASRREPLRTGGLMPNPASSFWPTMVR